MDFDWITAFTLEVIYGTAFAMASGDIGNCISTDALSLDIAISVTILDALTAVSLNQLLGL